MIAAVYKSGVFMPAYSLSLVLSVTITNVEQLEGQITTFRNQEYATFMPAAFIVIQNSKIGFSTIFSSQLEAGIDKNPDTSTNLARPWIEIPTIC
jgi:hypothetical protein